MEHSIKLSVRTYTQMVHGHDHPYHQILIPIFGKIDLQIDGCWINISYGKAAVIHKNLFHHFKADEKFRFIVLDLNCLPKNISEKKVFTLDESLLKYISFVDEKLMNDHNINLEKSMSNLLYELLENLKFKGELDTRIYKVINIISENINHQYSLDELCSIAHLSKSQLKVLFKKNIGLSIREYCSNERMKKAVSLLVNTDMPLTIIAAHCGYQNLSAFSKRFSEYHGIPPTKYRSK
ncbi:helix-turn-helix transcriptional regulator [Acinetobacter seifertii]|nr:helix-turn-helix transcriptional regulator [Acinetobacter seifertii]